MNNRRFRIKIIIIASTLLFTVRLGLGTMYTSASDITVDSVLRAVNNERIARNIPALNPNSHLSQAANSKSQDMINRHYFAHVDPDGHYIWDKIVADGYTPYTILGENLAIDFSDTEGLMSAWIDSPTHRANLLNASFKDQGMGIALGDSNSGEYSIAITNTFGAQPAAKAPVATAPTAPVTTPTPKTTAPAPKTTTPKPAPIKIKPEPVSPPKVVVKKGVKISINNSESVLHTNHLTLVGNIDSNIDVTLSESANRFPATTITPDQNGNFVYALKDLENGKFQIIASAKVDADTVSTPPYNLDVEYFPPQLDDQHLTITPELRDDGLNLHIVGETNADTTSVTATVLSQTAQLQVADSKFEGDLTLSDKYLSFDKNQLVLGAQDRYGNKTTFNVPLSQVQVPQAQNPKTLANAKSAPDLYNVFKYIVIFFGLLFTFFLTTDSVILNRKKITDLDQIGSSSNLIVILLIISSLALVTWWH